MAVVLKRVRGCHFQGYDSFDVTLTDGEICIVGANMTGKSTFGRAVIWAWTGTVPASRVRVTKDVVRPAVEIGAGIDSETMSIEALQKAVKEMAVNRKKKKGWDKDHPTIVQIEFVKRLEDGDKHYVLTRVETGKKTFLSLETAEKDYSYTASAAQEILFNLAGIPVFGTQKQRTDVFIRLHWFGVGQPQSFFNALPAARKNIVESLNPSTKLPAMKEEADRRSSDSSERLLELETTINREEGALHAKAESLSAAVSSGSSEFERSVMAHALEGKHYADLIATAGAVIKKLEAETLGMEGSLKTKLSTISGEHARLQDALSSGEQKRKILQEIERLKEERLAAGKDRDEAYWKEERLAIEEQTAQLIDKKRLIEQAKAALESMQLQKAAAEREMNQAAGLRDETLLKLNVARGILKALESFAREASVGDDSGVFSAVSVEPVSEERGLAVAMSLIEQRLGDILGESPEVESLGTELEKIQKELKEELSAIDSEGGLEGAKERCEKIFKARESTEATQRKIGEINGLLKGLEHEALRASEASSEAEKKLKKAEDDLLFFGQAVESALLLSELLSEAGEKFGIELALSEPQTLGSERASECVAEAQRFLGELKERSPGGKLEETVLSLSSNISSAENKHKILSEEHTSLSGQLTQLRDEKSGLSKELSLAEKKLSNYAKTLDSTGKTGDGKDALCDHCASPLSKEHLSAHIVSEEENVLSLKKRLNDVLEKTASLEKRFSFQASEMEKAAHELGEVRGRLFGSFGLESAFLRFYERSGAADFQAGETALTQLKDAAIENVKGWTAKVNETQNKKTAMERDLLNLSEEIVKTASMVLKDVLNGDGSSIEAAGCQPEELRSLLLEEEKKAKSQFEKLAEERRFLEISLTSLEKAVADFTAQIGVFSEERSLGRSLDLNYGLKDREKAVLEIAKNQASNFERLNAELVRVSEIYNKVFSDTVSFLQISGNEAKDANSVIGVIDELKAALQAEKKDVESVMERLSSAAMLLTLKEAALSQLEARFQKGELDLTSEELGERLEKNSLEMASLQESLTTLGRIQETRRIYEDVKAHESRIGNSLVRKRQLALESHTLSVIRQILAPNGDARTLALSGDVAAVVEMTNADLGSLSTKKTLSVDLKLEKDSDQKPAIDIVFEVDGMGGGNIMPSMSQEHIVCAVLDLSLRKLSRQQGFIFFDEPETALDDVNKIHFTNYLRSQSIQTILITNNASAGFINVLSTDKIRKSTAKQLTGKDFGLSTELLVEAGLEASRKTASDAVTSPRNRDKKAIEAELSAVSNEEMERVDEGEV